MSDVIFYLSINSPLIVLSINIWCLFSWWMVWRWRLFFAREERSNENIDRSRRARRSGRKCSGWYVSYWCGISMSSQTLSYCRDSITCMLMGNTLQSFSFMMLSSARVIKVIWSIKLGRFIFYRAIWYSNSMHQEMLKRKGCWAALTSVLASIAFTFYICPRLMGR